MQKVFILLYDKLINKINFHAFILYNNKPL
jgi:hypothetical protein